MATIGSNFHSANPQSTFWCDIPEDERQAIQYKLERYKSDASFKARSFKTHIRELDNSLTAIPCSLRYLVYEIRTSADTTLTTLHLITAILKSSLSKLFLYREVNESISDMLASGTLPEKEDKANTSKFRNKIMPAKPTEQIMKPDQEDEIAYDAARKDLSRQNSEERILMKDYEEFLKK